MEVPKDLKRLVQLVMRGFYSIEQMIVVDLLIRRIVLKEDEIIELLRFERKQLRSALNLLRNDKLIKFKLRMETGVDGKAFRQNYYYINYKDFVNVVKYKLDHIRKKFELIDRDNTSRASFICSFCQKSFTDLEVDMLIDPLSGELKCTHCGSEVIDDPNHLAKPDSRKMLAKFNETMEPLYMLLKDIEDIRLTSDLLDPDIESRVEQANQAYDGSFSTGKWADKKKGIGPYASMQDAFNVKIEDPATTAMDQMQPKKEQPVWMLESTISGASSFATNTSNGIDDKFLNGANVTIHSATDSLESPLVDEFASEQAKEILEMLQRYETPNEARWRRWSKYFGFTNEDEEEEEDMQPIKEEILEQESMFEMDLYSSFPKVKVAGALLAMAEIEDRHILLMSDFEKNEYTRVAQQIYASIFDI